MENEDHLEKSQIINNESWMDFMIKSYLKPLPSMSKNERPSVPPEKEKKEKEENSVFNRAKPKAGWKSEWPLPFSPTKLGIDESSYSIVSILPVYILSLC